MAAPAFLRCRWSPNCSVSRGGPPWSARAGRRGTGGRRRRSGWGRGLSRRGSPARRANQIPTPTSPRAATRARPEDGRHHRRPRCSSPYHSAGGVRPRGAAAPRPVQTTTGSNRPAAQRGSAPVGGSRRVRPNGSAGHGLVRRQGGTSRPGGRSAGPSGPRAGCRCGLIRRGEVAPSVPAVAVAAGGSRRRRRRVAPGGRRSSHVLSPTRRRPPTPGPADPQPAR